MKNRLDENVLFYAAKMRPSPTKKRVRLFSRMKLAILHINKMDKVPYKMVLIKNFLSFDISNTEIHAHVTMKSVQLFSKISSHT